MAAIETGCPYYIYNPGQTQHVTLNDTTDTANFVGYITDITGLDDSGVRENAQVIVAGDGGYHGPFWQDRRPWTMSGIIMPIFPLIARDASQEALEGVFGQAMQQDGFLTWLPADGVQKFLPFRKQQPVRVTKGQSNVEKTFQLSAVTADYRVLGWTLNSAQAFGPCPFTVAGVGNGGNADAAPFFKVFGPVNTFAIINVTTGKQIKVNVNLPGGGDWMVVDLSGTYPLVYDASGTSFDGAVDPLQTDWTIAAAPGNNTFQLAEGGSPTSNGTTELLVQWRNSWR